MKPEPQELLPNLPKIDKLIEHSVIFGLQNDYPRTIIVDEVREYIEILRTDIIKGRVTALPGIDEIANDIARKMHVKYLFGVRRCVNGAGIILHTALGRAPFAGVARKQLMDAISNYCSLQIDLETGKRGNRNEHIEKLIKKLTGAEAALVVNNNAAATLLVLNTLAEGKEVIVSRGELVEIGGAFRIPDVMKRSGARLVEVGATNRTHLKDYSGAITDQTALLLKVHQSNFRIIGFTKQIQIDELTQLAHEKNILAFDDIGSGALIDLSKYGLPKEPLVQDSIKAGADVVCFSGDKLLGGPQCGIIAGKKEIIARIKNNQLMRALRCDKMTFVILEATLRLFLDEKKLLAEHPVMRMLTMDEEEIVKRCKRLKKNISPIVGDKGTITIEKDESEIGSGSLAGCTLPTNVVAIQLNSINIEEFAKELRLLPIPVIGRIKENKFIIDCRTVLDEEIDFITAAVQKLLV